jgi:hypothetical protein
MSEHDINLIVYAVTFMLCCFGFAAIIQAYANVLYNRWLNAPQEDDKQ